MFDSIAILISGRIRIQDTGIDKNYILNVIDNLRNQFSFFKTVHIYYTTWLPENKEYKYDLLNEIENKVDFLIIKEPPEYNEKYDIKSLTNPSQSKNLFKMFSGVNILCEYILKNKKKYDYLCRCRNDVLIQCDFKVILSKTKSDYVLPLIFWTYSDCVNDQFCITSQDNFMKIWNNPDKKILDDFIKYNMTPEKYNKKRLIEEGIKFEVIVPYYYNLKGLIYVDKDIIIIKNLNEYMKDFIIYLCKMNNIQYK